MNISVNNDEFTAANSNRFEFPRSTNCFPIVEREVFGIDKSGAATLPIPAFKAIYCSREGVPVNLGVVGADYKPVLNADLYAAAEEAFRKHMTDEQLRSVECLDSRAFDGAECFREYRFPGVTGKVHTRGVDSEIGFRTIIGNGYNGRRALTMFTGLIDWYCLNGMVSGEFVEAVKRRHVGSVTADMLEPVIAKSLQGVQTQIERLNRMTEIAVDANTAESFLKTRFSERRVARLLERFKIEADTRGGQSAWALYSALTYYSTHNSNEFGVRNSANNDNEASVLFDREKEIARVVNSQAWRSLVAA